MIWGAYHGSFLILDRLFLLNLLKKLGKFPAMICTFLVVMIGWVVFRLESMAAIKIYMVKLFTFKGVFSFETIPAFASIAVFAILGAFIVMFKQGKRLEQFFYYTQNYALKSHLALSFFSLLLLLLSISSIISSDFNPFIYFRF